MNSDLFPPFVLGIVEGFTEFLPVSSTGHLIIVGHLLSFVGAEADTFEVVIQLGAILAVIVLYLQRFVALLPRTPFSVQELGSSGLAGWAGLTKLAVACGPAFVAGALFHKAIKEHLFNPTSVAIALILGGVIMIAVDRLKLRARIHSGDEITWRQALLVGCFQCLALFPGVSRSASTIIGGLTVGLPRHLAAEFSFLVAVPIMVAATGLELVSHHGGFAPELLLSLAVGFIVSFLSALVAIRLCIGLVTKYGLAAFGWYRIVLGVVVLAFI